MIPILNQKLRRPNILLEFHEALRQKTEQILSNIQIIDENGEIGKFAFKKPDGSITYEPNVYKNRLPVALAGEDDTGCFPYCIIRLSSGETAEDGDFYHVAADFYFGAYEDDVSGGGDVYIQTMREAIDTCFEEEPLLNHLYRAEPDTSWVLQDSDTYPYYFGALAITFSIPKMKRKDAFSDGYY